MRVTFCEAVTAATVAEKEAVVDPEGTDTVPGTVMAVLLLARLTARPVFGAAPLRVTEQLSVPAPIIEDLEQVRPEREGVPEPDPFPCSLVVLEERAAIVSRLVVWTLSVPVESAVDLAL